MGRRLDVSMLDTIFSILETGAIEYTIRGHVSSPEGNRDPGIAPFDSFRAADGMFVMACGTNGFWHSLCEIMEMPEMENDPRFADNNKRVENYVNVLKPMIEEWSMQHTVDDLENMIVGAGIPFSRVLRMDQVCNLDILKKRHMLWNVYDTGIAEEIAIPGTPIKMHGCADEVQRSAPLVGEHTERILKDILHYNDEEINTLKEQGVI